MATGFLKPEQLSVTGEPAKSADRLGRVEAVDVARGVALIAMTLFHFGWDLELFGFAPPGFALQPAMVWFARSIANSFLFLVGVSLVLAYWRGFNPKGFLKRLAMIVAAALAITVATYFATPNIFIFFGILHHIAVASVLGLLFVRLPWWLVLAATVAVLWAGLSVRSGLFNAPIWWWTGLSEFRPRSSDFVPLFPFFASVLAGIAATRLALTTGVVHRLSRWRTGTAPGRLMKLIGRHSLLYYLLHQPVMIAILYVVAMLVRPG